jgi:hypothetical protein
MTAIGTAPSSADATVQLRALAAAFGGIPAPCQVGDADDWYEQPHRAAAACQTSCHGMPECHALGFALDERNGVWGGRDFAGRRKTTKTTKTTTRRTP